MSHKSKDYLWVDFNDIDKEGYITTLTRQIPEDFNIFSKTFIVGDYEGNRCSGTLISVDQNTVLIKLNIDTFESAPFDFD